MGLAASQARFLCITARKANCEYKSTALAQEKLEITDKMSQVSNDYAQALNATRLMWCPDGMDKDFNLAYSLLMTPSAANDFNPYMLTTPSGAVVLNTAYMEAAKAAGISKTGVLTGGVDIKTARNNFILALADQGIVTPTTANEIVNYVPYGDKAGMGAEPKIKGGADAMTLAGLILSESIGQQKVDWAKILAVPGQMTQIEYDNEVQRYRDMLSTLTNNRVDNNIISQIKSDMSDYKSRNAVPSTDPGYATYQAKLKEYEDLLSYASNIEDPKDSAGNPLPNGKTEAIQKLTTYIQKQYDDFVANNSAESILFDSIFNTTANDLDYGENGNKTFSIVESGVINHYKDELANMTLGDILSGDIVLMANGTYQRQKLDTNGNPMLDANGKPILETVPMTTSIFAEVGLKILTSLATILGYNTIGQGLNVDEESSRALKYAFSMTKNTFLKASYAEKQGNRNNDHAMTENSAYENATKYNRIGTDSNSPSSYYALDLSNMMAAFLTYYENAMTGVNSDYLVAKSVDSSVFITQNSGYVYIANDNTEELEMQVKDADFFDELFNNLLEYGWRYDCSVDDNEYLEAAIKNGRYSLFSLNMDGYYYQTRYSNTGYMVEVSDTDAIARAEAEFIAKKAELTAKEDSIDLKSKQLDAEIASLATELDSVKNFISKSIEKTFTMFSN